MKGARLLNLRHPGYDFKNCIRLDRPRPIRFKSYPRVSHILLSCTSPGIRFYMSCTPYTRQDKNHALFTGTNLFIIIALRHGPDLQLCDKRISRLRRHVKLSGWSLLMCEKLFIITS